MKWLKRWLRRFGLMKPIRPCALPCDFIAIWHDTVVGPAPSVILQVRAQAGQQILRSKGRTIFPPTISATRIPERIRDVMWWKPTCLVRGESYEAFKKRADAQRGLLA